jgi:glucose-6-phosphate isomerase
MQALDLWRRYQEYLCRVPSVGMSLDISRIPFDEDFFACMDAPIRRAFDDMRKLEAGDIANPDEGRMVGHYWLRAPKLAPDGAITRQIEETNQSIKQFVRDVHDKRITPPDAVRFTDALIVGIGGSALGPQLIADALGTHRDKMRVHFLDNTDPDGFDRMFKSLGGRLKSTLVIVISKSGGTKETRNGMLETEHAFTAKGIDFPRHAVAVTGDGSQLDQYAKGNVWLARFPMWDWVGGRTSVMSAVGLLPAALQGVDIDALLSGAAKMDEATRKPRVTANPAALLALMWYHQTAGRGEKDMVVLPYKDRLLLMSRYLQQLVMESIGKQFDLDGNEVNQGIAVYGNKGSTDQHAYVQQLREGVSNFFVNFIVVLQDRTPAAAKTAPQVEHDIHSGDYLSGFWQGTRRALYEAGRYSMLLTIDKLDAKSMGALIALYERAVGFYASLVNINAYHQPGVEAGKKAAQAVIDLQTKAVAHLRSSGELQTAGDVAAAVGSPDEVETVAHILNHLAANKRLVTRTRDKYCARD